MSARTTVYNKYNVEEHWEQVNEENKYLLENFLIYLKSAGRADGTIDGYKNDISIFFVWLLKERKNKSFIDLKPMDIVVYQHLMVEDMKLSPSAIKRRKAGLSSMSNFIIKILRDEYPDFENVVTTVESPKETFVREKTVYTDRELDKLLDKLVEEEYYQQACGLALAMCSGSRKSELTRFKVDFFREEHKIAGGSLYYTPEKIETKGSGLNLQHRYILTNPFDKYLDLWMKERRRLGIQSEYLLVRKAGSRYMQATPGTLDSWAKTINRFSKKHFYWHSLRHYFTTHLSSNNIPAPVIQKIVGWKSLEMVARYDDTSDESLINKYFGEDGIKKVEEGSLEDM